MFLFGLKKQASIGSSQLCNLMPSRRVPTSFKPKIILKFFSLKEMFQYSIVERQVSNIVCTIFFISRQTRVVLTRLCYPFIEKIAIKWWTSRVKCDPEIQENWSSRKILICGTTLTPLNLQSNKFSSRNYRNVMNLTWWSNKIWDLSPKKYSPYWSRK